MERSHDTGGMPSLAELQAAVEEFQRENPPGGIEVPAHPALRLAAGACDFVVGIFLSAAMSCLLFWFVALAFHPDYPISRPLFCMLMSLAAGAYTLPEAVGHPTIAKSWFRLRLSAIDADTRRAFRRRWILKAAPWLVLAAVWAVGALHMAVAREDVGDPNASDWVRGLHPKSALFVAGAVAFLSFLSCFGANRQALYDRASGTLVVRKVPLRQQRGRGFDVIPTARLAQSPPGTAWVPPVAPLARPLARPPAELAPPGEGGYLPAADEE